MLQECEEKIIQLGRLLMNQVKSGIESIERYSPTVGQIARHPISKSKEYKDFLVEIATVSLIHTFAPLQKCKFGDLTHMFTWLETLSLSTRVHSSWIALQYKLKMDDYITLEDTFIYNSYCPALLFLTHPTLFEATYYVFVVSWNSFLSNILFHTYWIYPPTLPHILDCQKKNEIY